MNYHERICEMQTAKLLGMLSDTEFRERALEYRAAERRHDMVK